MKLVPFKTLYNACTFVHMYRQAEFKFTQGMLKDELQYCTIER